MHRGLSKEIHASECCINVFDGMEKSVNTYTGIEYYDVAWYEHGYENECRHVWTLILLPKRTSNE